MSFNVYISNKIGTEAVGVFQLIMSIYMFFITFACSGINLATTNIISEQLAYGLESGIKKATKKCIIYSLIMGSLACIALFIFSPTISFYWLHNKVSSMSLKIIAISLPFISVSSCINGYFCALKKIKRTATIKVIEQFFKILLIMFLFNYFLPSGLEYSLISLVLGSTISEILSFLLLYFTYMLDKKKLDSKGFADTNYTKHILKISVPISITSYIRSGLSTLKQILIPMQLEKSGMSCDIALSKYGIINGMVMPLILFPFSLISSFSELLIPEFSYFNAKKDYTKINFSISKILKFCFIFSFLIMGFFWCFSNELSILVYQKIEISNFIKLLSPLIVLIYIDNIVDSILKGLNKQVSVMGINILDLFTSISFIYFLLPIQGIKGYIIVLFISEIINGLLSFFILLKETKLKIDFSNWIIKPLFSVIFLNLIFSYLNHTNELLEFIFYIVIFTIFYFIILILSRGLVKKDIRF